MKQEMTPQDERDLTIHAAFEAKEYNDQSLEEAVKECGLPAESGWVDVANYWRNKDKKMAA